MTLAENYKQFKSENPKVRIRDAAKQFGTTEVQLVAIGEHNIRLRPEFEAILNEIPKLGHVMALTRNDHAVHERKGVYTEATFQGKIGLVVNPDIDLRLFLFSWAFAFAVIEGERKSIQFFAKDGSAIHKIYLTERSDTVAYQSLLTQYQMDVSETAISVEEPLALITEHEQHNKDVDVAAFQADWLALQDTHNFFGMLKQHGVGRLQALQIAPEGYSRVIPVESLKALLYGAAEKEVEIMVFIGNNGCLQIHTGKIKRLVQTGPWFNVLDEAFNMHLREDNIFRAWMVKKPTSDGVVTSIEVFDAYGSLIVQFFGKRKPGIPELSSWRELVGETAL